MAATSSGLRLLVHATLLFANAHDLNDKVIAIVQWRLPIYSRALLIIVINGLLNGHCTLIRDKQFFLPYIGPQYLSALLCNLVRDLEVLRPKEDANDWLVYMASKISVPYYGLCLGR